MAAMPTLSDNLILPRCPHCAIADPNLRRQHHLDTTDHSGDRLRRWSIYVCSSCGGIVSAWAERPGAEIVESFPASQRVADSIPGRPRAYLQQARESAHAPAGAVMLIASAVDSMLKLKGYGEGNLYSRLDKAAADKLIPHDMPSWAQGVRLDANDARHADEAAALPSVADAQRAVEFASTLADILFVLPGRVQRGLLEVVTQNVSTARP